MLNSRHKKREGGIDIVIRITIGNVYLYLQYDLSNDRGRRNLFTQEFRLVNQLDYRNRGLNITWSEDTRSTVSLFSPLEHEIKSSYQAEKYTRGRTLRNFTNFTRAYGFLRAIISINVYIRVSRKVHVTSLGRMHR